MDIIDGRNMELLNKLRLNQKSPIFPGLDLCLHVRLDLGFWCLFWRGLANTRWPAKACWPSGQLVVLLQEILGGGGMSGRVGESSTRQGWTNVQPVDPPGPIPAFPTLPGLHCLCSSMPTTVGMPQLCLEMFEPFILGDRNVYRLI